MPENFRELRVNVKGTSQLRPVIDDLKTASQLASTFGRSMTGAFQGAVLDGRKMKDVLRQLTQELSRALFSAAMKPVEKGLTSLFGAILGVPVAAKGMVLDRGRVAPFARGGIVSRPTLFPMANGAGLMGEAGPEAILPLSRGPDGRLGVDARGRQSGGVTVNMSINPDFRGADANAVAALSVKLAQLEKSIPGAVVATIERVKAVRPGTLR